MVKEIVTKLAPLPIGCYSQGIITNNLIFTSGQIGLDLSGNLIPEFTKQVKQAFYNLDMVLNAGGSNLSNIIKLNLYLISMEQFNVVNEIMQQLFSTPYPSRSTVAVSALPKNALFEVDAIASLKLE
jgi:2-iminobutanoate/2-iminopropanoate deaminase